MSLLTDARHPGPHPRGPRLAIAGAVVATLLATAAAGPFPAARGDDTTGSSRGPSQQEVMTARGLVRNRGAWRTPQEIELFERAEKAAQERRDWATRLERLRKRLDSGGQADAAEQIREISDPAAVPAVAAALATEPDPRVRAMYVEALGRVRGPEGAAALLAVAIDHADPETRRLAVERLAALGPEPFVPPLVAALAGDDNPRINRAAEALGGLRSFTAVAPLIAALETEHVVVVGDGGPEGSTTATFTPTGGGLSMGSGPKRRKQRLRNERVLEALVAITGANFEWNAAAWRAWLAGRQTPADFDPRRG
jgi:HEAT repeat protein